MEGSVWKNVIVEGKVNLMVTWVDFLTHLYDGGSTQHKGKRIIDEQHH
jgi:hypothetical protein